MPQISICIPVYNFFIEPLISKLSHEISINSVDAEIVVIDDASHTSFENVNHALTQKYRMNYIQLQQNAGRSAIRNLFLMYVRSPLLLFLDCDVMPGSDKFISTYLSAAKNRMVVCGGISYADKPPGSKNKLHWKYGRTREALPAIKRNQKSHRRFLTSNFLIHKKIFETISFKDLKGYGYEDTLYGIELQRHNIKIEHIDLPAQHLKIDNAEEFILKTENALINLHRLHQSDEYASTLKRYIRLINANNIVRTFRLTWVALLMNVRFGKTIRRRLLQGNTNLALLDLYKLLFFISLGKEQRIRQY